MNFARRIIRSEMNRSSAAMLLRLYLRLQLLWFIVWAASDLFLVWYWTGRISGPGAHEYFGRWFLAWLFTQKLPLYFLSLPDHGRRYTIGSMYAFLNWRFYRGRSFGEWFAAYSLWAAIPPSLALGALTYLLLADSDDYPEGKQLRGLRLITPRQLSRELRHIGLPGDHPGIDFAGVQIPGSLECEHFLTSKREKFLASEP